MWIKELGKSKLMILSNVLQDIYRPLLDSWFIIDNSRETSQMIAFERDGVRKVIAPEIFAKIFQSKGEI